MARYIAPLSAERGFLWVAPRSPVAAALCVNCHNLPGRDVLSLRLWRDSRGVFLPDLARRQWRAFLSCADWSALPSLLPALEPRPAARSIRVCLCGRRTGTIALLAVGAGQGGRRSRGALFVAATFPDQRDRLIPPACPRGPRASVRAINAHEIGVVVYCAACIEARSFPFSPISSSG